MVWMDTLHRENPFAVVLFALLLIMLYYFPVNNQVLAFYPTAIPFWAFLFLWLNARRHAAPVRDKGTSAYSETQKCPAQNITRVCS